MHNAAAPTDRLVWRDPAIGRLCRYTPVLGLTNKRVRHGLLYGHVRLNEAMAATFARTLDAIPQPAPGERIACPAGFGTHDLLVFGYADGRMLTVLATPDGCPSFTNGRYRTGTFSPAFARYLRLVDRLVPPKHQAIA